LAKYFIAAFSVTFLTAVAQVLLKTCTDRAAGKPLRAIYLNLRSFSAYLLFAAATLGSLFAYSVLPLKFATVVLPFNYIFVGLFSRFLLKERLVPLQWLGALLILSGIAIFNS
jgi:drug/metabolite transporter (DMT)-like permease